MVGSQLIALLSAEPGAGRRTLAEDLGRLWVAQGKHVLIIGQGPLSTTESPSFWVSRFQTLSPFLLRNYLADPRRSYAQLFLPEWSSASWLNDLFILARLAFDRILVLGPSSLTVETAPLWDAMDLLLWMAKPRADSEKRWSQILNEMAAFHLPQNCIRLILSRMPSESMGKHLKDLKPLVNLPEDPHYGFRRRNAIEQLAQILNDQSDLYRVRQSHESCRPSQEVVDQLKHQVQPQLLKALETNPSDPSATVDESLAAKQAIEACLAADMTVGNTREERGQLVTRVLEEVLGLGPLEVFLKDPDVSEILVNGIGTVYVEKKGKLHPTPASFSSENQLRTMIDRIVSPLGRRVDESSPLCDARLADGSRVNIVLPPLALDGPSITIRKFSAKKFNLDDLAHMGSLSQEMADFLKECVLSRQNIVVSGGTGSGKTTLLNALSSAIPADERIVTIEDAAELKLQKPHVVRLESRPANAEGEGAIPIRRLVINALRMRPDRIVIGECRGGEALDMLQAMNTGHDGSLTTLHANTPRDALGRLETLVLMAGMDLPMKVVREQIRSAVHLIIQQSRLSDGARKVTSITEVTGIEGDTLTTQELFRYTRGQFERKGIQVAHQRRPAE